MHNPVIWMHLLQTKTESFWLKRGERMVHVLLKDMVKKVPAYRRHLAVHKIRLGDNAVLGDIGRAPVLSKESYLRKYSLPELCWNGSLSKEQRIISATSGSTGEPFYFPRTMEQDMQYAAVAEMYLRSNFSIHKKSTLYIVGWGMGVWIGGVFSYSAVRLVAERGKYHLSIITPGTSNDEILKAVQRLGPFYDQVLIGGYPPMIKDLVDEGMRRGMKWKKYNIKFIFSAEGFTEAFRSYITTQCGLTNPLTDTLNHYGSVDLGTMAHETPLSILIRRLAEKNPFLNEALFGHPYNQPTLAQYIPELFYFEAASGSLLCSARSGLPLVRYDLIDSGGIHTFAQIRKIFADCGIDLSAEIRRANIGAMVWNLPFVFVFERRDFTVKIFGANIYPSEIRRALETEQFEKFLTGKHTAEIFFDKDMNQSWIVHVELRSDVNSTLPIARKIQKTIVGELAVHNSEFANNLKSMGERRMTPKIQLWPYKSFPHFASSGKHSWVRKA